MVMPVKSAESESMNVWPDKKGWFHLPILILETIILGLTFLPLAAASKVVGCVIEEWIALLCASASCLLIITSIAFRRIDRSRATTGLLVGIWGAVMTFTVFSGFLTGG